MPTKTVLLATVDGGGVVQDIVVEKQCKDCKKIKPIDEFYIDRAAKDGHAGRCKPCDRAYSKANKARRKNNVHVNGTMPKVDEDAQRHAAGALKLLKEADSASEILAAVKLLVDMPREDCEKVVRMVEAYYMQPSWKKNDR